MRRFGPFLVLEIVAFVALAFALLRRHHEPDPEWTSYVPLMEYDAFDGLTLSEPVLWLGISFGFAAAGVVVLIPALIAHRRNRNA